ncbi:MAG: carbohydrate ABC transporter permease [Alphaproteobacteria bacterium]
MPSDIAISPTARRRPVRARTGFLPYALLLPSVLLLGTLIAYPLGFALKNSFYFWNLAVSPEPVAFVGFDNYAQVLESADFLRALGNTVALTVAGTVIEFVLGLSIALVLATALPGMSVARALLILPTTIAPIVVGFLYRYMYDPSGGLAVYILNSIGLSPPLQGLLGNANTALASVLFADVWQWTPFVAIILYAGLLSVPQDIMEAARLDGASRWTMLIRIKLPLIRQTALIVVMLRFMQLFNTFDLVLVLTRGGPGTASRTLGYSLYELGLVQFNIGLASALTWIIVILVNIFIGIFLYVSFKNRDL